MAFPLPTPADGHHAKCFLRTLCGYTTRKMLHASPVDFSVVAFNTGVFFLEVRRVVLPGKLRRVICVE